ncbi:hypothetical protein J6590_020216 [Homalodisca vitripennis]|nr:hypothetical protein J6590_020216 [Homalodisca vitripennis]
MFATSWLFTCWTSLLSNSNPFARSGRYTTTLSCLRSNSSYRHYGTSTTTGNQATEPPVIMRPSVSWATITHDLPITGMQYLLGQHTATTYSPQHTVTPSSCSYTRILLQRLATKAAT